MKILKNISLKGMNTFKVSTNTSLLVSVEKEEELKEAVSTLKQEPFFILGGGSNVIIHDEINVLHSSIKNIEKINGTEIKVGSGYILDDLIRYCLDNSIYGMENLSGIPGTLGGAVIQNAGAYGVEISQYVDSVFVFDIKNNKYISLKKEECGFGYRKSIFQSKKHFLITSILMSFPINQKLELSYPAIKEKAKGSIAPYELRDLVLSIRKDKFPDLKKYGTGGSFFKNIILDKPTALKLKEKYPNLSSFDMGENVKIPSGILIEQSKDKIKNTKNVYLSDKHFGIIISNLASIEDIDNFANQIEKVVFDADKIALEREVIRPIIFRI